jgi:hypothetical protein
MNEGKIVIHVDNATMNSYGVFPTCKCPINLVAQSIKEINYEDMKKVLQNFTDYLTASERYLEAAAKFSQMKVRQLGNAQSQEYLDMTEWENKKEETWRKIQMLGEETGILLHHIKY